MRNNRRLAYLALMGNVVIWGAALPIVKPALSFITPYYFLFWRYVIASLCLSPFLFYYVRKTSLPFPRIRTILLIESVQILVSLLFLYEGLESTPALTASLIGSAAPMFVTLGGIWWLHEREEKREWIGLAISVLGTLVIIVSSVEVTVANPSNFVGVLYLCGYLITNALYLLLAKKHYHHENKMMITAMSSLLGMVGFGLIAPLLGPILPLTEVMNDPQVMRAIVYMGILGTPVAMSLLLYGQSQIEASEASLFTYLQPLVYIPLAVFWLGDTVSPWQLGGLLLVSLGVFLAEKRL